MAYQTSYITFPHSAGPPTLQHGTHLPQTILSVFKKATPSTSYAIVALRRLPFPTRRTPVAKIKNQLRTHPSIYSCGLCQTTFSLPRANSPHSRDAIRAQSVGNLAIHTPGRSCKADSVAASVSTHSNMGRKLVSIDHIVSYSAA